jgi:threonine aldolase
MPSRLSWSLTATILNLWYVQLLSMVTPNLRLIDLRSDTVTKPSPAMRTAMFEAVVGDDVFGDDPTINILEQRLALTFGKESALFFPSGTMSNLAATMSWCGTRGSEMIMGDSSHIFLSEQGGVSALAGVMPRTIPNELDGTIRLEAIERAVRQSNIHFPVTELIALEDTHNFCGGRVLPKGYLEAVSTLAKSRNIAVHLDGARIWNAATASQTSLSEIVKGADSVSVCLSKGLGAPSGSVLLGPRDFIDKARRCRKVLGGGMRQVGILAAAGLQALTDFEGGLLVSDHSKAKQLANAIAGISGFSVAMETVETNIVLVNVNGDGDETTIILDLLKERGVLVYPFGYRRLRLVTHRDILNQDIEVTISAFRDVADKVWHQPLAVKEKIDEHIVMDEPIAMDEPIPMASREVQVEHKTVETRRLITKVLGNTDIFRPDLTYSEVKAIVDAAQGIRVFPGDMVIRQGDSAEFFYVIEVGSVSFYLETNGEYTQPVKTLIGGGFFGEMALMYDAPRAATVLAGEETILWRIHKENFFSVQKTPENKFGYFKDVVHSTDIHKDLEAEIEGKEANELSTEEREIADVDAVRVRLSIAEAQAEALRFAQEPGYSDMNAGEAAASNTWEDELEEELIQGLESGGQAVSLSEDDEEEVAVEEKESEDVMDEEEVSPTDFYEEAVIHGMSLSDKGFCVFLKGVVCDRVLRVLVTPSDPMADGLDVDQVETSEAVTLLQLLQGIDVESILARDALAAKFAELGPGKQQYSLKRVMIDGISTARMEKTFHARLLGSSVSSTNGVSQFAPAPTSSHIEIALPVPVAPQLSFDHPSFEPLIHSEQFPGVAQQILQEEGGVYPPESESPNPIPALVPITDYTDWRRIDKEVEIDSAFEAIALALRHSAVVEVRSSLLQDEHVSYSIEELPFSFPTILTSDKLAEKSGRFGADYDSRNEMERLQRRLFEAIRQGNSAKIDSMKRQLEFYSHIEGRSVLIMPPPQLFLAPDMIAPEVKPRSWSTDNELPIESESDSSAIEVNPVTLPELMSSTDQQIQQAQQIKTEPAKIRNFFNNLLSPLKQRDQQALEQEFIDQTAIDAIDIPVEGQTEESVNDMDDGLGQQLTTIYDDHVTDA